jgi:hypothetical protein
MKNTAHPTLAVTAPLKIKPQKTRKVLPFINFVGYCVRLVHHNLGVRSNKGSLQME